MPRKSIFTREEIVEKAFGLVQKHGIEALSARNLGETLGVSSRPIFTFFRSMDEVQEEVRRKAHQFFDDYMAGVTDYTPAFKEYGIRLIRFGKEEEHLFKMLFLSKETRNEPLDKMAMLCTDALEKAYNITHEEVMTLMIQCWTFTCGMAVLSNTGAVDFTDEQINELLARQFVSTLTFIKSGKELPVVVPRLREVAEEEMTLKIDI